MFLEVTGSRGQLVRPVDSKQWLSIMHRARVVSVVVARAVLSVYVRVGFVTMCAKNVLTAGIFTIKLTASFVAPLFFLPQTKTNPTCSVRWAVLPPCAKCLPYRQDSMRNVVQRITHWFRLQGALLENPSEQTGPVVWTCRSNCTWFLDLNKPLLACCTVAVVEAHHSLCAYYPIGK